MPQNELTPFHPYSPYAVAKLYGFWIVKEYREAYGMFCCSGILFNHESERRGETFVTRKITLAAARIAQGTQDRLYLGNLSSLRDWGYARDYVECMWLMLCVGVLPDSAAARRGTSLVGKVLVEVSPDFYRPTDVVNLWGDPTKARRKLAWNPQRTTFEQLVYLMTDHDLAKVAADSAAAHVRTNLAEYLEKGIVK